MGTQVRAARVYDEPTSAQGTRVLVDRIWPRGIRKDDLPLDRWLKQVAPSTQLRTWYGHDPEKYAEFAGRYRAELEDGEQAEALAELRALAAGGTMTLLTASKDLAHSQAAVLAELLGPARH